ncbi:MAG TPA: SDR family NAD(P)-dependent oxidoreductase [Acidimicrobiales bacterium]|nr:SDR family NAD(P)-dependent oxidoreductase [Acidimicrobiales bacterium]
MDDVFGVPQTVVVLGGSSDLARAVLRLLAQRGLVSVLLAGRHQEALEPVARELTGLGVDAVETVTFDARDTASHETFADEVARRVGPIDLVIVAAGVLGDGRLEDLTAPGVADVISADFTGLAAAMIAFSRILRRQGHGRFVVFSSATAVRVRRANFVYGAAKAGLDGFSQGLGDALRGSGVDTIVVRPGFVATKMTAGRRPMPLSTTADAVAGAVVRALGTGEPVVWVPRVLGVVMPLARCLPRSLWRRLPS